MSKAIEVRIARAVRLDGVAHAIGATASVAAAMAGELIATRQAYPTNPADVSAALAALSRLPSRTYEALEVAAHRREYLAAGRK